MNLEAQHLLNKFLKEEAMAIDLLHGGERLREIGEDLVRANYKLCGRVLRPKPFATLRKTGVPAWAHRQCYEYNDGDNSSFRTNLLEHGRIKLALFNGHLGFAGVELAVITAWDSETDEPVIPPEFGIEKAIVYRKCRLYPAGKVDVTNIWAEKMEWAGPFLIEKAVEIIDKDRTKAWDAHEWYREKNPLFLKLALEGSVAYKDLEEHPARKIQVLFTD